MRSCEYCGNPVTSRHAKVRFCSRQCGYTSLRNRLQAANPNWKGEKITSRTGNDRARRWYPETLPCEVCGEPAERHHHDSNPKNNDAKNINFLCRKHHMEADGRLKKLIEMSKTAQPLAALAHGFIQRNKQFCKRGHPLSGDNLNVRPRKTGTPARICKKCTRRRDRLAKRLKAGSSPWRPGSRCGGRKPIDFADESWE